MEHRYRNPTNRLITFVSSLVLPSCPDQVCTYWVWSFTPIIMSGASANAGSSTSFPPPPSMPAHRNSFAQQHPPRAPHHPTCRCPQCYLRSSLFPRSERGKILLPRPSSLQSSMPARAMSSRESSRPGSRAGDSSEKGKGKEVASSPRPRSRRVDRLAGPGQPRSPTLYSRRVAPDRVHGGSAWHDTPPSSSHSARPTTASGSSSRSHLRPPQNQIIELSPAPPLPSGIERKGPRTSPRPRPDGRTSSGSKRKLSELYDTLDPTEHVLDFRNPPPPQGREPLRGFPRRRISRGESSYSRKGTPESHATGIQSYRSHVSESESSRSILNADTDTGVEIGSSSRQRSLSEQGLLVSAAAGPSRRPGRSSSSDSGYHHRRSSPTEPSQSRPSVFKFSARSENPQPLVSLNPTTTKTIATTTEGGDVSGSGGPSSTRAVRSRVDSHDSRDDDELMEGRDPSLDPDADDEPGSSSSTYPSSMAAPNSTPIRFREPLTADSRQDRRVVKGGVAVIQVKWDSDRKRRQGYFAPDAGAEKSRFRHYSKDDCCFDG
ncbi:hypothetical protein D9611_012963 [Ephemerocybe angulata]|uniref:Uncharacterized protein n=1 Tax=Ephemerocybe angulata TaxID=980116 RepID=A0A8H5C3Z7_9AGAR|nr:hypothetical protein D9611_012963 [Tulosesus angulatus]